ncbi:unnamed protein product [Lactuca virosa]|uniref:MADS-box domain-containing protein n=1 Tax=Lactuca virosa TaxID=75947 RepID=A0AAU9PRB2_9ASTR|nr:unnamed protein product [Lactuca virosa]
MSLKKEKTLTRIESVNHKPRRRKKPYQELLLMTLCELEGGAPNGVGGGGVTRGSGGRLVAKGLAECCRSEM